MKLFSYAITMSVGMETTDFSVCIAVHRYGKPSATIHKIASAEELLSLSVCLVCKIQTRTVQAGMSVVLETWTTKICSEVGVKCLSF